MKLYPYLILCLLLTSCCRPCTYKYHMEDAQEFVLDSYRIKQGKFSILELEGESVSSLPSSYLVEYDDVIDEDDTLVVTLTHPIRSDLVSQVGQMNGTVGFRVRNGKILLPIIDEVEVKGLTLDQAREKIEEHYHREISNVSALVEYRDRIHGKVELMGAVAASSIPITGRTRLYEVLSIARVAPNASLFKSYLARDGRLVPVDMYKLIHDGDMSQNIVMRPKDKIYIADPSACRIMIMGEIGMSKVIPIPSGFVSLREALAAGGGIPFTGDKRCIQVIRGNIASPKIYRLSWNHITYLPNDSLLLMPGDTIYISERPITKWNRFIEQLLPSSVLFDLGVKAKGYCGW